MNFFSKFWIRRVSGRWSSSTRTICSFWHENMLFFGSLSSHIFSCFRWWFIAVCSFDCCTQYSEYFLCELSEISDWVLIPLSCKLVSWTVGWERQFSWVGAPCFANVSRGYSFSFYFYCYNEPGLRIWVIRIIKYFEIQQNARLHTIFLPSLWGTVSSWASTATSMMLDTQLMQHVQNCTKKKSNK